MPNKEAQQKGSPHEDFFACKFTIMDAYGLHARPAANLVKAAQGFKSEITLRSGSRSANAKSILDILSLAANRNAELTLECRGEDAPQAGEALLKLLQTKQVR